MMKLFQSMATACLVLSAWVTVLPTSVVGFQQLQPHSPVSTAAFKRPSLNNIHHAKTFQKATRASWLDDKKPISTSMTEIQMPEEEEEEHDNGQLFEAPGKGILRDYKARLPLMRSDITDGLNVQVRQKDVAARWLMSWCNNFI